LKNTILIIYHIGKPTSDNTDRRQSLFDNEIYLIPFARRPPFIYGQRRGMGQTLNGRGAHPRQTKRGANYGANAQQD
uniref:Uncharacterized protein n=1 Tax=Romanomermis culicivorax TaxID=13658 RepID=A0A915KAJ0_ROMCU